VIKLQGKGKNDAQAPNHDDENAMKLRWQLMCGAIASPLFIITFLIEGVTRAHYNPLRHPVSSLSIGDLGWIQRANFIILGLLLLSFAMGLWRIFRKPGGSTWGPLLVGFVAVGFIGAGIFTTDPLSGYPPGTPLLPLERTTPGILHDIFSTLVFLGLPAACFVFARQFFKSHKRGWGIYSIASGVGMYTAFYFAAKGFQQAEGFVELGGLYQRLSLIIGLAWLTRFAIHLMRRANGAESVRTVSMIRED
jgi:hypothetical protein